MPFIEGLINGRVTTKQSVNNYLISKTSATINSTDRRVAKGVPRDDKITLASIVIANTVKQSVNNCHISKTSVTNTIRQIAAAQKTCLAMTIIIQALSLRGGTTKQSVNNYHISKTSATIKIRQIAAAQKTCLAMTIIIQALSLRGGTTKQSVNNYHISKTSVTIKFDRSPLYKKHSSR